MVLVLAYLYLKGKHGYRELHNELETTAGLSDSAFHYCETEIIKGN